MRSTWLFLALIGLSAVPALAQNTPPKNSQGQDPSQNNDCPKGRRCFDASIKRSDPEVIRGPAKLTFLKVNRLRYRVNLGNDLQFTAGPNLSLAAFIPNFPSTPAAPAAPSTAGTQPSARGAKTEAARQAEQQAAREAKNIDDEIDAIRKGLEQEAANIDGWLQKAKERTPALASYQTRVTNLVQESDSILGEPSGEKNLLDSIKDLLGDKTSGLIHELQQDWPSTEGIQKAKSKLNAYGKQLDNLSKSPGFQAWQNSLPNYKQYNEVVQYQKDLMTSLAALEEGSDQKKAYDKLKDNLQGWAAVLKSVNSPTDFQMETEVQCGYPFFKDKNETFRLIRVDRTVADSGQATSEVKVVTVECPSALAITGGIGYTTLDQREIAFISSPGANNSLEKKFGYKGQGPYQVNPMILIHTRFADCGDWDFHATAGTVFDINNSSSKVTIGYILGASASVRDGLFLTSGVQIGRVGRLGGGFNIGDPVPEKLTEPPIVNSWRAGFFFGASFRIR